MVAFTDTIPDGLTVVSATAGSGTCTTSGHTVAGQIDPNPGDDTATAMLAVAAAAPAPGCIVPALKRTPLPVAKRVLALLQ